MRLCVASADSSLYLPFHSVDQVSTMAPTSGTHCVLDVRPSSTRMVRFSTTPALTFTAM